MRRISVLAAMVVAAGVAAAVAGAGTRGGSLSLVGYSTPKTVMGKIIQLWQQTPAGKDVSFTTSYGPSGDQARAVAAARREGKTDKQARAFVQKLFSHVVSQDSSGRNATNTFLAGKGDVLLTYESEAVAAQQAGQNIGYLVPAKTMLIELPIAPTKTSSNVPLAKQFIAFTKTAPAQELLAQNGYRPVLKSVAKKYRSKFPTRALTTISSPWFGGWRKVDKRWF